MNWIDSDDDFSDHARAVLEKSGKCPNCRMQNAAYMTGGYGPADTTEDGIPIVVVGCCYIPDDSVFCKACGYVWNYKKIARSAYLHLFASPKCYVVLPESFHSFMGGFPSIYDIFRDFHTRKQSFLSQVGAATLLHEIDYDLLQSGDSIIGWLPPHEIAAICAMGCRYFHLIWNKPINDEWLKKHPDKTVSVGDYMLQEFFAKEIQHDGPISKCVSLETVESYSVK